MIEIDSPFDREAFIRSQKTKSRLELRSYYIKLVIYFSMTSFFIILNGIDHDRSGALWAILSFILVIVTFNYFVRILNIRHHYRHYIQDISQQFAEEKMDCSYKVSEDLICYSDQNRYFEFKWKAFSSYSIYRDYLLIYERNTIYLMFSELEIDNQVFQELLELTKSKLKYRKP